MDTLGHLMVYTYWLYRLAGHSACLESKKSLDRGVKIFTNEKMKDRRLTK